MNIFQKFRKLQQLENSASKISGLLENNQTQICLDNSEFSEPDLNTERLKRENIQYSIEDARQQYKTRKKSVFIDYLLYFFTWTIIPNFYVGRKRWAQIQLISLLIIAPSLIILSNMNLPSTFYSWLDEAVLLLIVGVLFFDFCTLWFAVVQYNSKLYDLLFMRILEENEKSSDRQVMKRRLSNPPTPYSDSVHPLQVSRKSSSVQRKMGGFKW